LLQVTGICIVLRQLRQSAVRVKSYHQLILIYRDADRVLIVYVPYEAQMWQ